MKKYHIILCILVAAFMTTSCGEGFLDVKSPDQLYVDEYYNSQERIFEALVAAYDPLQWLDYAWGYSNLGLISDVMSDDVYVGGENSIDQEFLHRMFNYTAQPTSICGGLWTALYSGINRSNIVHQYMDNVPEISNSDKALYLAEATVLRSFYYTWLWKLWGNVPYYTENLEFPYLHEQNSADEVYEGIISSIEDAIANGGLPMRVSEEWSGRVTKAFAYMLYTDVVMYQKDQSRYNTALKYMEEIIASSEYGLVDDFAGIWEVTGEWSKESIYEISFFNENGGRSWNNAIADGGTVYPKLIGLNELSENDTYDDGWGFEPVRATTYEMYHVLDKRRDGGLLNIAQFLEDNPGVTYKPRYQDEGIFLKKYLPRKDGNKDSNGAVEMNYGNNCRLYRYSETLLNAAELLLSGATGTGSAQDYLNQVRRRAGLESVPVTASLTTVLQERRYEFVGEGKRYWDLIRTGNAPSVLVPDGKYRTNAWSETKKYLPIPQDDIDAAMGTLTQNPY